MAPSIYRGLNGIWMQCNAVQFNDEGVRNAESDTIVINYEDDTYTVKTPHSFSLMQVLTFGRYQDTDLTIITLMHGEVLYIDVPYDEFQKIFSEAMTWQLVALRNA